MEERRLEKDVATNLSDCVPQGRNGPCARSVRIIFTADSQENDMDVTKKLVMRFTRAQTAAPKAAAAPPHHYFTRARCESSKHPPV